ncbi:MAG: rRNA cytosine-C5-methyltransferase [Paramuribaculum sp.]|nr:rRNA cytosine-C5-methyltransferase [Paramuribaculum sp.]
MTLSADFLSKIRSYGTEAFDRLEQALHEEAPVSVRLNPRKPVELAGATERVPWWPGGLYLAERPAFTFMPELHQGCFYVQEAASMFIARVISFLTAGIGPIAYLDACAAPGGKTTAAIDALPSGSVVVANEYVASRADILRENLAKWGVPDVCVTQGDVSRFARMGARFDIVAADVPCSGEGMMRKDPKAVEQWSPALVKECAARQHKIVDDLWPALKPGGYLIYSTCTYAREEDEEMIRYIVDTYGAEPVEIPVDPSWNILPGIDTPYPCYRFIPGTTRSEGLFMAVLRKPADDNGGGRQRKPKGVPAVKTDKKLTQICGKWLDIEADIVVDQRGRVIARPAVSVDIHPELRPALHIADIKGRDPLPTVELALSAALRPDAFPTAELDYDTAIEYLRGNAITLAAAERGPVIVTYCGRPLGIVKNLGNRANNLHPAPWRILKRIN